MKLTIQAETILKRDADEVEAYLRQVLGGYAAAPRKLVEAIEYSLLAGGKRLRPALVMESWRACGGTGKDVHSARAAAGAIELIHTFSLVHDDLPAMDDDDLRRGRPTNHKVFGEAMAILAGDAMVTAAFELLAADADAALVPRLVLELASASGPEGMIGGQVLDIAGENQRLSLDELQQLHRRKTGALLVAACRMGAVAARANASQLAAVSSYARPLGLAFQIVDDLLDVTATPQQLGKATGKDATLGKNTYPGLLGVEGARKEAAAAVVSALAALGGMDEKAEGLRSLARFVQERSM